MSKEDRISLINNKQSQCKAGQSETATSNFLYDVCRRSYGSKIWLYSHSCIHPWSEICCVDGSVQDSWCFSCISTAVVSVSASNLNIDWSNSGIASTSNHRPSSMMTAASVRAMPFQTQTVIKLNHAVRGTFPCQKIMTICNCIHIKTWATNCIEICHVYMSNKWYLIQLIEYLIPIWYITAIAFHCGKQSSNWSNFSLLIQWHYFFNEHYKVTTITSRCRQDFSKQL